MPPLVIFVEEPSMEIIMQYLHQRLCPDRIVRVIPHEGKSDLRLSFPRKIGNWKEEAHFLILHDKDSHPDCVGLKKELFELIPQSSTNSSKIRIVMNELESWYLSDLKALEAAGLIKANELSTLRNKSKFRDVERLNNAKQEFLKLVKIKGQRNLARRIGPHLDPERSNSFSFKLVCKNLTYGILS